MIQIGNTKLINAVVLAPMEDVTDLSFRLICKELGADIVYTEFVNSEGLVRATEKTHKKLKISESERPVGIQIYGSNIESMVNAAIIAESEQPDLIDINAGCWVKNVVGCGAGASLLKDPVYFQNLVKKVVDAVKIPVTVKTRLGWDSNSIQILDVAKRIEDAGAKMLTVHCRTRAQGHKGDADWSWLPKIKQTIDIPVILNGNVLTALDVINAFNQTGADGIMIARGAIGNPWIFKEAKELLAKNDLHYEVSNELKIKTCLRHLELAIDIKGEKRAVIEHRKFYSGYLKGMPNSSAVRNNLMAFSDFISVREVLLNYSESFLNNQHIYGFGQ
jgi:tRNA-dihydrouridine synthase B